MEDLAQKTLSSMTPRDGSEIQSSLHDVQVPVSHSPAYKEITALRRDKLPTATLVEPHLDDEQAGGPPRPPTARSGGYSLVPLNADVPPALHPDEFGVAPDAQIGAQHATIAPPTTWEGFKAGGSRAVVDFTATLTGKLVGDATASAIELNAVAPAPLLWAARLCPPLAGAVLGGLAGATVGSKINPDSKFAKVTGAVLGGLVGAGLGSLSPVAQAAWLKDVKDVIVCAKFVRNVVYPLVRDAITQTFAKAGGRVATHDDAKRRLGATAIATLTYFAISAAVTETQAAMEKPENIDTFIKNILDKLPRDSVAAGGEFLDAINGVVVRSFVYWKWPEAASQEAVASSPYKPHEQLFQNPLQVKSKIVANALARFFGVSLVQCVNGGNDVSDLYGNLGQAAINAATEFRGYIADLADATILDVGNAIKKQRHPIAAQAEENAPSMSPNDQEDAHSPLMVRDAPPAITT
ncbi:hypothetical protein PIN31115_04486 [Pandoraea iniqua]|uniref:Uncharacterized protein n=1 Tax=Pandoraea iniqua TaxID=2508288 RepID=A0A5E4YG57_9BURK|nr:hypothetical protein [Pandoraea iniqua]VVE47806.1 hypothetical protein PIN31115_04486 [Pandoraea iniqua]